MSSCQLVAPDLSGLQTKDSFYHTFAMVLQSYFTSLNSIAVNLRVGTLRKRKIDHLNPPTTNIQLAQPVVLIYSPSVTLNSKVSFFDFTCVSVNHTFNCSYKAITI